jgi:uncharacterized protein (DUF1330 family)
MPAYLIAQHKISDPARFEEYRSRVAPLIASFGGRYITRPGSHQVLGGDWHPDRVVLVEFSDMPALRACFDSPAYAELIPIRQSAGIDVMLALDGV